MADTESQQKMENAANEAEKDLENISNDVVLPMAQWVQKWYGQAGYKRLGRILVNIAKNAKS